MFLVRPLGIDTFALSAASGTHLSYDNVILGGLMYNIKHFLM